MSKPLHFDDMLWVLMLAVVGSVVAVAITNLVVSLWELGKLVKK